MGGSTHRLFAGSLLPFICPSVYFWRPFWSWYALLFMIVEFIWFTKRNCYLTKSLTINLLMTKFGGRYCRCKYVFSLWLKKAKTKQKLTLFLFLYDVLQCELPDCADGLSCTLNLRKNDRRFKDFKASNLGPKLDSIIPVGEDAGF